jgi:hypothetical protein
VGFRGFGQSEIQNFYPACGGEHDVAGLQITMENAAFVSSQATDYTDYADLNP